MNSAINTLSTEHIQVPIQADISLRLIYVNGLLSVALQLIFKYSATIFYCNDHYYLQS